MSRKKKSNDDIIAEYYDKKRMSKNVRNLKVNEKLLYQASQDPNNEVYVDSVYEKFNIHRYANRKEFVLSKLESMPNIPNEKLDDMWRDYQHRHLLIKSGQYEEWRYTSFRENYISAMKNSAFSLEAIKNVENIPLEKWKEIIALPTVDKHKPGDTLFPKLGGFQYGKIAVKFAKAATDEIKEAFRTLGLTYIEGEQVSKATKMAITAVSKMNIEDSIETAYNIDNTLRILKKQDKERLLGEKFANIESEIVTLGTAISASRIKTSKTGNRYIPFVGSTREGTKNEKFVKALLKGHDIYK